MAMATKINKINKKKWGHEENSSDLSPKKNKRVYKKMKVTVRQQSKKEIDDNL